MPKVTLPGGIALDDVPKDVLALGVALGLVLAALLGGAVLYWREVAQPQQALVTQQQANAALRETMDEYMRHLGQVPEAAATLMDDARGVLTVGRFGDNCTLLERTSGAQRLTRLIPDPARDAHGVAASVPTWLVMPVEAASRCDQVAHGVVVAHDETSSGCWTTVWRRLADGCEHTQLLDACHGVWYAPAWTVCNH